MRKLHSDKFLQILASAELRFVLIEGVTEKAKYVGFFYDNFILDIQDCINQKTVLLENLSYHLNF